MTPQIQQELLNRLDALATKLGVGAQSVWQIYATQMRVSKVEDILCIVGFAVALVLACGVSFATWKITDYGGFYFLEIMGVISSVLLWIAVICLFISSLFCIDDLIQIHYNPNYWILQHIVSTITSTSNGS